MNLAVADSCPVLQNILPDSHIRIVEILAMGIDEFGKLHSWFPLTKQAPAENSAGAGL